MPITIHFRQQILFSDRCCRFFCTENKCQVVFSKRGNRHLSMNTMKVMILSWL